MSPFTSYYRGLITALLYTVAALSLFLLWFTPEIASNLGVEDGPVENMTALLFLIASAAVGFRGIKLLVTSESHRLVAILAIFAAAIFFLFAGEEISWGQRIFGIESGEFIQQYNWQGELNLHNLQTDVTSIGFHYGAFVFLIVMPFFHLKILQLIKKKSGLKPFCHFIAPYWIAAPAFPFLGMLDSRFVYVIEKPWAASLYLTALTAGLALLMWRLLESFRQLNILQVSLLSLSLLFIILGLLVSYIYAIDKQATNSISEYKELIIALLLCSVAVQWKISGSRHPLGSNIVQGS